MSSDAPAIRARNVSKTFRIFSEPRHRILQGLFRGQRSFYTAKQALRDISFDVNRGEIVGIIGANGAGKTTLLATICGTTQPSSGSIEINGRIGSMLDLGTGFNPDLTGYENLILVGAIRGFMRREVLERMDDILAFADIGDAVNQEVRFYSSGMYMRLAFALCIHLDPDVLVVDEALAVGDEAFQRKCYARLRALRAAGRTIIFVTHSTPLILELCDSALLLDGGELLCAGKPKRVVESYQKLIYSAPAVAHEIRQQIRDGVAPQLLATTNTQKEPEFYDDTLSGQPSHRYPHDGAQLSAPLLLNADERQVNVVESRQSLVYQFTATFSRAIREVRFGMLIKSLSGAEIGGRETSDQPQDVSAGSTLTVAFRFKCGLNPGVYFLNAGVLGLNEQGEEVYLDRIIDALQIRVLPNHHHQTATVDLGIDAVVTSGSAKD